MKSTATVFILTCYELSLSCQLIYHMFRPSRTQVVTARTAVYHQLSANDDVSIYLLGFRTFHTNCNLKYDSSTHFLLLCLIINYRQQYITE